MNQRHKYTYRPPADVDPYARELIAYKVRRLVAARGITRAEGEDLSQDLLLHAHVVTPKYDVARGARTTFFEVVLARKLTRLLAARAALKRDGRRVRSIEVVPEELLPTAQCALGAADVAMDVREALADLPADLCPVADLFTRHTAAEVARTTGLTRQRVRGRRARIALHLRKRGVS